MKHMVVFLYGAVLMIAGCAGDVGTVGGSGLIETEEIVVSAEATGRVVSLEFAEGSTISEGDTLLTIDPSRIELELASAQAGRTVALAKMEALRLNVSQADEALAFASSERDRVDRLLKSGTANQKQYDAVEFERTQAEIAAGMARANVTALDAEIKKIDADLARLERSLADCYCTAPISGTAVEKLVDAGELLAAGKPVVKIARLDTMWVKVYLAAPDFAQVRIGDKARVDTETGGTVYDGTVVWTSDEAEFTPKNVQTSEARADLVYAVKVQVPNNDGKLKIGMPVFVTLGSQ
jgi:HlyD family secretion protein